MIACRDIGFQPLIAKFKKRKYFSGESSLVRIKAFIASRHAAAHDGEPASGYIWRVVEFTADFYGRMDAEGAAHIKAGGRRKGKNAGGIDPTRHARLGAGESSFLQSRFLRRPAFPDDGN